jgi:hypothetical protein
LNQVGAPIEWIEEGGTNARNDRCERARESGVFGRLSGGGFSDPNVESSRATGGLKELFETGDPNFILLVTAKTGSVDDR